MLLTTVLERSKGGRRIIQFEDNCMVVSHAKDSTELRYMYIMVGFNDLGGFFQP